MVTIEEFSKLEIRIAKIEKVEDIPGSDKLYKLTISLGSETRTIVAGVKKYYSKEELLGRQIAVIANLEPRVIKGITSQGMLLAAVDEKNVGILSPLKEVALGSRVS